MVTKSAPAAALMLLLLSAVELKLKELLAADDIKTIYRIEGAARAMVSMARVAAAAQRVTDPEPASNTAPTPTDPEDETMNAADPNAGLSPREHLERRRHRREPRRVIRLTLAGVDPRAGRGSASEKFCER